jgi:hypothetical protein
LTITITKSRLALAIAAFALLIPATAYATHTFSDVPDDKFYTDAVEWAFDNGITTGTSATTFEPDAGVTRGQNVTFAKRYDDNIVQPALTTLTTDIAVLEAERVMLGFDEDSLPDGTGTGADGVPLTGSTPVVVRSVTVTAPSTNSMTVLAQGSATIFTEGLGNTTTDHFFRCWISDMIETSPDFLHANFHSVPVATAGVGFLDEHAYALTASNAVNVAAGASTTLYLQCDDFINDASDGFGAARGKLSVISMPGDAGLSLSGLELASTAGSGSGAGG